MIWIILGLIFLVFTIYLIKMFLYADPKKIIKIIKWLIILSLISFFLLIGLKFSSFFLWLALPVFYFSLRTILGIAISKFFGNLFNSGLKYNSFSKNKSSNISSIETEYLSMSLNQSDGKVDGIIKKGNLAGKRLEELSIETILELRDEVMEDRESVDLLEAYLDRITEKDWRSEDHEKESKGKASTDMSLKEAYLLLGLDETATIDEIKEAHHRLMLKNHPDQGGSNFLATKINQAKEVLLKNF